MKKILGTLALALAIAGSALASTGSRACCEPACDDCASCCAGVQSVQSEASCPLAIEQASLPTCN